MVQRLPFSSMPAEFTHEDDRYLLDNRLPETLPQDVLQKMHAPPKTDKYAVLEDPATLESFDGILFGIPTRYGNMPAQFKVRRSTHERSSRQCYLHLLKRNDENGH